jgi:hypothetical protein
MPEPSWRYLWVVLDPQEVAAIGLPPLTMDRVYVRLWGWVEHLPENFDQLSPTEQHAVTQDLLLPKAAEIRNLIDHRDAGLVLVPQWYEQTLRQTFQKQDYPTPTLVPLRQDTAQVDDRQYVLPLADEPMVESSHETPIGFEKGGSSASHDANYGLQTPDDDGQHHSLQEVTDTVKTVPHRRRTRKRDVKASETDVKASENDVDVYDSVQQGDVKP